MKLECPVVKDLYVLYNENELSEEVKVAVDEHLGQCEECKNIYDSGDNFQTSLQTNILTTTQKLDDKIMMKLKLVRLKVLLLFIISILVVISYNIYSESRRNLNVDFSRYSMDINILNMQLGSLKSHEKVDENSRYGYNYTTATLLDKLNKEYEPIYRDLNPIEKYSLKTISRNQCFDMSLTNLILMLNIRLENGYWSDKDEKVYSILKKELDNLEVMSQNASHGLNSWYYMLNTKEFLISFNKINELSKLYTKYNKLPQEIKFLSQDELKDKIKNIINEDIQKIELRLSDNNNYDFTVHIKDSNSNFVGTIESYTGRIVNLTTGDVQINGTLINLEKAEETAKDMALKVYGKNFDIKIKDLGINSNYSSYKDAKVYCFEGQLTYKGYKIFSPISIHVDGYTNKILDFSELSFRGTAESNDLRVDVKFTPELAIQNVSVKNLNKDNFTFTTTHFIKSMFSGEYVLVHEYIEKENKQSNEKTIYINTYSGKIELPAYEDSIIDY